MYTLRPAMNIRFILNSKIIYSSCYSDLNVFFHFTNLPFLILKKTTPCKDKELLLAMGTNQS